MGKGPSARKRLGMAIAAAMVMLAAVPTVASAITANPVWKCRASALHGTVTDNNRIEPIVANGIPNTGGGKSPDNAQCARQESGFGNLATPVAIPTTLLAASTASAITDIAPELGLPKDQKIVSAAEVENLAIPLESGTTIIGVRAARSRIEASCKDGVPQVTPSSEVVGLTLGGQDVSLDALVQGLADALAPLSPLIEIKPNEQITENGTLTVRALHIKVLNAAGPPPLLDIVIAETKIGATADTCTASGTLGDSTGGGATARPCPRGAEYDLARNLCIIRETAEGGVGGEKIIVVGRPYQGPSGGTVMSLEDARRRYKSPCLQGSGPQFVMVGSNRADRLTGTNRRDRILGLGGKDSIDGGRSDDCLDGGRDGDSLSGGIGADRVYGFAGGDHLNGGAGSDRLSAGSGNDTVNAAYGADRVFGGPGRDFINVATAGKRARVSCGSGTDKVRLNHDEARGLRGCEIRYVFGDRPRGFNARGA